MGGVSHTSSVYKVESQNPKFGAHILGSQTEKDKIVVELTQWEHNNYLCKNYILNGLADDMYDYYSSDSNTVKQVCDALKKKYDIEEAGAKKYVVSRYFKYQMTYQWKFSLMKSRKLLTRSSLKNHTSKNNNKNGNPPKIPIARKQPPPRNDLLPFLCCRCGKEGHMARKCMNKSGLANQANLTEEQLVAMITEINLVGGSDGWWIETGASHHVCYDRAMFKTYTAVEDKKVLLGDSHTTNVVVIGDVELIFTSRKTLILKDVMHTPEIKKNLTLSYEETCDFKFK
uniref:Uncharacterized protein LOC101514820 n=1 Tax=Cicer arietinum TaxID=3827 RepID=A0A1S2YLY6_CICAR|nr:uncharacterized protein LOC101514820 [Cicer arietinum]